MNNNNYSNTFILVIMTGIFAFTVLAMTSTSFSQASAQMTDCQTSLSLNSNPSGGTVASGSTLPVYLLGELKCGDSGIGSATVIISGIDENTENVITNEYGKYSLGVLLAPGEYSVEAFFAGDETHVSATAIRTITVNELV
jgi:hypothetical protein